MIKVIRAVTLIAFFLAGFSLLAYPQHVKTVGKPIVISEFIFENVPFASAHASTIVETKHGLVAAWFSGTHEGASDVAIWSSRFVNGKWTNPVEIANGIQSNGERYACWNPVFFTKKNGDLILFYKVGIGPQRWWGMKMESRDGGLTWQNNSRLPDGILGPIKNKPIWLSNGAIISPSSSESFEEKSKWRVHFELSSDAGRNWKTVEPPAGPDGSYIDAIQPSILKYADGRLQAVGRTRAGYVFQTWSRDAGRTWTPLERTTLPNPNSGTDAITLKDGRQIIVYNHTRQERTPLNVSFSADGRNWKAGLVIENEQGEFSYPSVIQTRDGLVHIVYTWNRKRIKHVVIDPKKIAGVPMPNGLWPAK